MVASFYFIILAHLLSFMPKIEVAEGLIYGRVIGSTERI